MSRLDARVVKLERQDRSGGINPNWLVGVARAPLPAEPDRDWAERLLAELGWSGEAMSLWVVDGAAPEVLLPLTRYADMRSEAEKTWLAVSYPHVCIGHTPPLMVVYRIEDEAGHQRHIFSLERELAT